MMPPSAMPLPTQSRRKRRWVRWLLPCAGFLLLVSLGAAYLAAQRVPAWYHPQQVSRAELTELRNSLPNTYQAVVDGARAAEPFEIRLDESVVTKWIVARKDIYPEAGGWLPGWIRDPAVTFQDGRCVIGVRLRTERWESIVGLHLAARVEAETLHVEVERVTVGALPVPLASLVEPLDALLQRENLDPALLPDPAAELVLTLRDRGAARLLGDGLTVPAQFRLRNAGRWVRLRAVELDEGRLLLAFDPA